MNLAVGTRKVERTANAKWGHKRVELRFGRGEGPHNLEIRASEVGELRVTVPAGRSLTLWLVDSRIDALTVQGQGESGQPGVRLLIEGCVLGRCTLYGAQFLELAIEKTTVATLAVDECSASERVTISDVSVSGLLQMRWRKIESSCRVKIQKVLTGRSIVRMRDYTADHTASGRLHKYTRRSGLSPFLQRLIATEGEISALGFFEFVRLATFEDRRRKGNLWAEFMCGRCAIVAAAKPATRAGAVLVAFRLFLYRHFISLMSPISILVTAIGAILSVSGLLFALERHRDAAGGGFFDKLSLATGMFHGSAPSGVPGVGPTVLFVTLSFCGAAMLGVFVASVVKRSSGA